MSQETRSPSLAIHHFSVPLEALLQQIADSGALRILVLGEVDGQECGPFALQRLPASFEAMSEALEEAHKAAGFVAFVLGTEQPVPAQLMSVEAAVFTRLPTHLSQLREAAHKAKGEVYLPSMEGASDAEGHELSRPLLRWLTQRVRKNKAPYVYARASELLQELGRPITPQSVFEESSKALMEAVGQLEAHGDIESCAEVHLHVKIHRVHHFDEDGLAQHPDLLQFWRAYEAMRQTLPPLDALQLTVLNGRNLDLSLLSRHLELSVDKLNEIFHTLDEKGILVAEHLHVLGPYRTDRELQFTLQPRPETASSVPLWLRTGEQREALLIASGEQQEERQAKLSPLLSADARVATTWEQAWSLVSEACKADDIVPLAGAVLAQLDAQQTPSLLLLWELVSAALQLPGNGASPLGALLPEASTENATLLVAPLRFLLAAREGKQHRLLVEYALSLPNADEFAELAEAFLQQSHAKIAALAAPKGAYPLLRRFVKTLEQTLGLPASDQQKKRANEAKQDNKDKTRGRNKRARTTPEAVELPASVESSSLAAECALAAAWAYHLLGLHPHSLAWIARASLQTPLARWRAAQIFLSQRQPQDALPHLEPVPETLPPSISQPQLQKQRKRLFSQLFEICKAETRCKSCPLHASAYCPGEAEQVVALAEGRPEEPQNQYLYRLSKRVRSDLGKQPAQWLNWLITEGPGQDSNKVERSVLRRLGDRKEADLAQLKQIALWCEGDGDWRNAMAYRQQILEQAPQDPQNLMGLAYLGMRQGDLRKALQWAIEATHADPRNAPLAPFLEQHREQLLTDLMTLRELLIELPAHPALSAFERELSEREETERKLAPQRKKLEKLLEQGRLAEAYTKAKEVLEEQPKYAPVRFQQICDEIDAKRQELKSHIHRPKGRDHKTRNKSLEQSAEEASRMGFTELADAAFRKLVKNNPQYGLGYIKWARMTQDDNLRDEAYSKAISLARNPEQRKRNLGEYAETLDKHKQLHKLLPTVEALMQEFPDEIPTFEPVLVRLAQQYSGDDALVERLESLLDAQSDKKPLKRVQKALTKVSNIDPWKRQLLSIKLKK